MLIRSGAASDLVVARFDKDEGDGLLRIECRVLQRLEALDVALDATGVVEVLVNTVGVGNVGLPMVGEREDGEAALVRRLLRPRVQFEHPDGHVVALLGGIRWTGQLRVHDLISTDAPQHCRFIDDAGELS
jgi:hypothetical protein